MKPIEIAFVCYAVSDLKKSREFYEKVLGLTPGSVWEGETMGFVEYEMGPHTLAIGMGAPQFKPGKEGSTVALEVEDYDKAIESLKQNKVKFLMDSHDNPSCRMALIEDPSGNQIMIHKRKAK